MFEIDGLGANPGRMGVLVLVKPDGVQRGLVDEVAAAYAARLGVDAVRRTHDADLAAKFAAHYAEHEREAFYPGLVKAMSTQGPVVALHYPGSDDVAAGRALMAELRAKHARANPNNTVHCSDSLAAAERETTIWFARGPMADDAERRRFELAKRIAGWGDAPASMHVDTIQLILGSATEPRYRLFFFCDESHAVHSDTTGDYDIDNLLERAAKIPKSQWRAETTCKREGRPGHGVSVSTQAFS